VSSQNQQIMFVFPGQGSQYVGMGSDLIRDFPVAQRRYEQASAICSAMTWSSSAWMGRKSGCA
jgi:malonyl CoA-acyl carrier protein transacylase